MNKTPKSLTCPSCGSPLQVNPGDRRVQCQYCHTMVDLPDSEQPVIILPGYEVKEINPRRRRIIIWISFAMTFLFLAGVAWLVYYLDSQGIGKTTTNILSSKPIDLTSMQLINNGSGRIASIIGLGRSGVDYKDYPIVYLDFNREDPLVWQSESLGEDAYQAKLLVTDGNIFFVDKTRLAALRRSDGYRLWEISLSDKLPLGCQVCLQEQEGTLFAYTQLGILHAMDAVGGKQYWGKEIESSNNQLYLFNSGPALVEKRENGNALLLFGRDSGEVLQTIQPTCPNNTFQGQTQLLDSTASFLPHPDGNRIFVAYGFWEPSCLELWDVPSGSRLWQAQFPEGFALNSLHFYLTDSVLYVSPQEVGQLWSIDIASGRTTLLLESEDFLLKPVYAYGGIIVLEAERTRGSTRYELWGINATTGSRVWQVIPEAVNMLEDNPSSIIHSEGVFAVHGNGGSLALLQTFGDPQRMTVEQVDMNNGTSSGELPVKVPASTVFTFELIGWQGSTAWVDIDGIYTVDTVTGKMETMWK